MNSMCESIAVCEVPLEPLTEKWLSNLKALKASGDTRLSSTNRILSYICLIFTFRVVFVVHRCYCLGRAREIQVNTQCPSSAILQSWFPVLFGIFQYWDLIGTNFHFTRKSFLFLRSCSFLKQWILNLYTVVLQVVL